MNLRFTYDTYRDVRHNTFLYFTIVLCIFSIFVYHRVLPPNIQTEVKNLINILYNSKLVDGFTALTIAAILSFLLVEIFKVHDHFYDRIIIRWRKRYDIDFILPRLVSPFLSFAGTRFLKEAEKNSDEFLEQLYYPFVGDSDTKIPRIKVVRFYEVVTNYWLTQMNELILILIFILNLIFALVPSTPSSPIENILLILTVGLINRLWCNSIRRHLRKVTFDEIDAIHSSIQLKSELETKVRAVCQSYNIPYSNP